MKKAEKYRKKAEKNKGSLKEFRRRTEGKQPSGLKGRMSLVPETGNVRRIRNLFVLVNCRSTLQSNPFSVSGGSLLSFPSVSSLVSVRPPSLFHSPDLVSHSLYPLSPRFSLDSTFSCFSPGRFEYRPPRIRNSAGDQCIPFTVSLSLLFLIGCQSPHLSPSTLPRGSAIWLPLHSTIHTTSVSAILGACRPFTTLTHWLQSPHSNRPR